MNTVTGAPSLKLTPPLPSRRRLTRLRWTLTGNRDRGRYGRLVVDGAHTHATIGLEARLREGHAAVAGWAIETNHPRQVEIAELRALLSLESPSPDVSHDASVPVGIRERIDHADQSRRAAVRLAARTSMAAAQQRAETRVARLERELVLIGEAADSACVRWDEYFLVLAATYARARSHRARGARPAQPVQLPAPVERSAV